jgi:hypothetical protein
MPRKRTKRKAPKRKATVAKQRRRQNGNGRVSDFIKQYQRPLAIAGGAGLLLASGAVPMLLNKPLKSNQFVVYDQGYPEIVSTF